MPELPEVETIMQRLRNGTSEVPPVSGQTIQSVEVTWARIIEEPDPQTFKQKLVGQTIQDVSRRGKFLHFSLDKGHLIGHLRMSGDIRMEKRLSDSGEPLPIKNYDRVVINFRDRWRMAFSNIRKFGRMWYVQDSQTVLGDLGPEPLDPNFTPQRLFEILQSHHRQIKPLLMDQKTIAGMGNIYTDEALFRAKIHPLRLSNSLSRSETDSLHTSIQDTLRQGIRQFGASVDWVYRGGDFQNHFNVYQKDGEPCPHCGTMLQKTLVGQRGTHFCPSCQKEAN
jgi:formamidopyrimidine-DNA glycosylase